MPTFCRSRRTNCSYSFSVLAGILALCLGALAMPNAHAQTIHQLAYNNSTWIDQSLSDQATDPHTGVAAFVTTPNDQIHTFYLDSVEEVHQLFFNGASWSDEDLTAEGFGVPAMAKSAVAGFSELNLQYVYYVSQNQHVHQLFYNNVEWADSDITSLSGGPLTGKTPRLTALATGSSGFHVYYLASNGHVNQLYNVSGSWVNQDITKIAKGPAGKAVWISSINVGNLQYVYYLATTGHVHELYYNNSTWLDEDLTVKAGVPVAAAASPITALVFPGGNVNEVFFIDNNKHLWQMLSGDNIVWASDDVTGQGKGPAANPANGIVAFTTTPNDELHLFYLSGKHINQLSLPAGTDDWQNQDLTAKFGGKPNGTSAMSGFSLANLQYLYYVSK